jgi:hypothetical protein
MRTPSNVRVADTARRHLDAYLGLASCLLSALYKIKMRGDEEDEPTIEITRCLIFQVTRAVACSCDAPEEWRRNIDMPQWRRDVRKEGAVGPVCLATLATRIVNHSGGQPDTEMRSACVDVITMATKVADSFGEPSAAMKRCMRLSMRAVDAGFPLQPDDSETVPRAHALVLRPCSYLGCATWECAAPPRVCSRCRKARYCSEACRDAHWQEHKHACRAFVPPVRRA